MVAQRLHSAAAAWVLQRPTRVKTALVLSGGGARGAYEAGVITYLRDELEPRLGRGIPIDILCGTSVGAVTACAMASTASQPASQAAALADFWLRLSLKQVLHVGMSDLVRSFWERGGGGLANPGGMRELAARIDWRSITRNIHSGRLQALSICATRVADGRTAVFVQQTPGSSTRALDTPHYDVIHTRIGPRHALASAAMPVLFKPVTIGSRRYLDGGVRMNVPLSPALRLGAQRVIVVSMQPGSHHSDDMLSEPHRPTAVFLAGKAMNSLLQDRLDQDVENMRRINSIIEAGYASFGDEFTASMNHALDAHRASPLRYVRNFLMRPSADLGVIAARCARGTDFLLRHRQLTGLFLSLLVGQESRDSADLASYLLFDPGFAEELMDLGKADARVREEEWVRFFDDTPLNDAEAAELERVAFSASQHESAAVP